MDELVYKQANTIYELWVDRGSLIKELDKHRAAYVDLMEEVEQLRTWKAEWQEIATNLQNALYDIGHSVGGFDILSATNAEIVEAVKAMADPHTVAGLQTAVEELTAERDEAKRVAVYWHQSKEAAYDEIDELATLVGEISDALELDENVSHDEILAAVKEAVDNRDHWYTAYSVEARQHDAIVNNLRKELSDLRKRGDTWQEVARDAQRQRDELQAKLDRLREVLVWYGGDKQWHSTELCKKLFDAIKEAVE